MLASILTAFLSFDGMLADGGQINGFVSYDETAAPLATNVRNLSPNATYALTDYAFHVQGLAVSPLDLMFVPVTSNYEFCMGYCTFSGDPRTQLTFSDGINRLKLSFAGTWGDLITRGSEVDAVMPDGHQVAILVTSDALHLSVPEPATWIMVLMGMYAAIHYGRTRKRTGT